MMKLQMRMIDDEFRYTLADLDEHDLDVVKLALELFAHSPDEDFYHALSMLKRIEADEADELEAEVAALVLVPGTIQ